MPSKCGNATIMRQNAEMLIGVFYYSFYDHCYSFCKIPDSVSKREPNQRPPNGSVFILDTPRMFGLFIQFTPLPHRLPHHIDIARFGGHFVQQFDQSAAFEFLTFYCKQRSDTDIKKQPDFKASQFRSIFKIFRKKV